MRTFDSINVKLSETIGSHIRSIIFIIKFMRHVLPLQLIRCTLLHQLQNRAYLTPKAFLSYPRNAILHQIFHQSPKHILKSQQKNTADKCWSRWTCKHTRSLAWHT